MLPLLQQIQNQTDDNNARLGHAPVCLMPLGLLDLEPACLPSARRRADVENDAKSLVPGESDLVLCSTIRDPLYFILPLTNRQPATLLGKNPRI
jgi:hypothetical protein